MGALHDCIAKGHHMRRQMRCHKEAWHAGQLNDARHEISSQHDAYPLKLSPLYSHCVVGVSSYAAQHLVLYKVARWIGASKEALPMLWKIVCCCRRHGYEQISNMRRVIDDVH